MHDLCCDLQRRGVAAWNVEYRRIGTGGGWPASLDDVRQAIAALPTLDEGRLDLGRTALVGHSAGGHLALLAAAERYGGITIAGVLGLAAVTDLALADELVLGAGAVRELLGDDQAALPQASPRARLPLGVRHVHVHGDADDRVPVSMTTAFVEASGPEAGVTVLPGVDHFALIDASSDAWAVAFRRLEELLGCRGSR
jgi:acetyl esterase/lipase